MDLKFNSDAKVTRTENEFQGALRLIGDNLANGQKVTHLYIDKECGADVRSMLDAEFKKQGLDKNFSWGIVKMGSNFRTGRTEYFTSETDGDTKHYKLCYTE